MKKYYHFAIIQTLLTVIVIMGAFSITGNPMETKRRDRDSVRGTNLNSIKYAIESYYNSNNSALPNSLADLPTYSQTTAKDPVTQKFYDYKKVGDKNYQLCANFETDSTKYNQYGRTGIYGSYPYYGDGPDFGSHKKGNVCFDLKVNAYDSYVKPVDVPYTYMYKGDSDPAKDEVIEGEISTKSTDISGEHINLIGLGKTIDAAEGTRQQDTFQTSSTYGFDANTIIQKENTDGTTTVLKETDLHVKDKVRIKYGYTTTGMYYARVVTKLE